MTDAVEALRYAMDGIRAVQSPYLPAGTMLVLSPDVLAGLTGSFRFHEPPPQYPEVGWKYEVRSQVRRGMADVLAWLGDNAPRELPDEDPPEVRRRRIVAEQLVSLRLRDPRSMVKMTGIV